MGRPSKSLAVHELHGTRDHSNRTPSAFSLAAPSTRATCQKKRVQR